MKKFFFLFFLAGCRENQIDRSVTHSSHDAAHEDQSQNPVQSSSEDSKILNAVPVSKIKSREEIFEDLSISTKSDRVKNQKIVEMIFNNQDLGLLVIIKNLDFFEGKNNQYPFKDEDFVRAPLLKNFNAIQQALADLQIGSSEKISSGELFGELAKKSEQVWDYCNRLISTEIEKPPGDRSKSKMLPNLRESFRPLACLAEMRTGGNIQKYSKSRSSISERCNLTAFHSKAMDDFISRLERGANSGFFAEANGKDSFLKLKSFYEKLKPWAEKKLQPVFRSLKVQIPPKQLQELISVASGSFEFAQIGGESFASEFLVPDLLIEIAVNINRSLTLSGNLADQYAEAFTPVLPLIRDALQKNGDSAGEWISKINNQFISIEEAEQTAIETFLKDLSEIKGK